MVASRACARVRSGRAPQGRPAQRAYVPACSFAAPLRTLRRREGQNRGPIRGSAPVRAYDRRDSNPRPPPFGRVAVPASWRRSTWLYYGHALPCQGPGPPGDAGCVPLSGLASTSWPRGFRRGHWGLEPLLRDTPRRATRRGTAPGEPPTSHCLPLHPAGAAGCAWNREPVIPGTTGRASGGRHSWRATGFAVRPLSPCQGAPAIALLAGLESARSRGAGPGAWPVGGRRGYRSSPHRPSLRAVTAEPSVLGEPVFHGACLRRSALWAGGRSPGSPDCFAARVTGPIRTADLPPRGGCSIH